HGAAQAHHVLRAVIAGDAVPARVVAPVEAELFGGLQGLRLHGSDPRDVEVVPVKRDRGFEALPFKGRVWVGMGLGAAEGTGSPGLFGFPGTDGKPIPTPALPLKGREKSGFGSVE